MSTTNAPSEVETRQHETVIEIEATVEEVWHALTDPAQLTRWFAPSHTVDGRPGGAYVSDWGLGLNWANTIEVWEPHRHLRLVEMRDRVFTASPVEEPLAPHRLVQDFHVEARAGKTVLRLVHSGFGASGDWDGEYEGTRGGWAVCFLRLKHVLERHRGDTVHNFLLPVACHGIDPDRARDLVAAAAPTPNELLYGKYSHHAVVLPERNGSIFLVSTMPAAIGAMAYVECLLFNFSDVEAEGWKREWRERLDRLFPATAGA